jgi:serine/threonine protein kinase
VALLRQSQRSNYRLLGRVGQGQFGQVYCAIHRRSGCLVALKNLNRDRLTTHKFLRELRFLLSLEHPNIANCTALEQSATGRQLVLDYCEAGTLRQLMEQSAPVSLAEILTWVVQVLEALDHAHSQGIVHCDIKPENILLGIVPGAWQVKISDFGIARLSQELRTQGISGATGSPAYMAPERFYHQYSAASDLYAVGVILFELVVGERPFTGTPNQLMVAHLNQTLSIPEDLPNPLQGFLRKALQKLVARRYRTAAAMKTALATLRDSLSVAELGQRYPRIYRHGSPPVPFALQTYAPLAYPVQWGAIATALPATAAAPPCFLAGDGTSQIQPWVQTAKGPKPYRSPWQLPQPVQALWGGTGRALAATEQTVYALLPDGTVSPQVTFPEPMAVAMAPSLQWVVGYPTQAGGQLWWARCRAAQEAPRALPLPAGVTEVAQLLPLDNRHVVLVVSHSDHTELHVVTRRGHHLGCLTLNTAIGTLVLTQTPHRILAQETGPSPALLIVDLLPFRVMRCRLDVPTPYLGELAIGYGTCSAMGQLRFVNVQGQSIGQIDDLPPLTAIAFQWPYHLWVASGGDRPEIHVIDVRQLGLDIIF